MDAAGQGVIYVSWGSVIRANTLPEETREGLINAFRTFKQQIILWKWENETLSDQPDNVRIQKWMPQRDVLCRKIWNLTF